MNVRRTVLAAVVTLAAIGPAGAAQAEGPEGAPCAMVFRERDAVTEVVLAGGPVAATGTLTCTVQLGSGVHSGADTVSASATGVGVVVLQPTGVWYPPTTQRAYLCTQFTPALGAPLYWTPTSDGLGEWSTDPGGPCGGVGAFAVQAVEDLVQIVVDIYHDLCSVDLCIPPPWWSDRVLDPTVCPILSSFPSTVPFVVIDQQGDVYVDGDLVWDCPPYQD